VKLLGVCGSLQSASGNRALLEAIARACEGEGIVFVLFEGLREIENVFEDADWAILEWRDPLRLRGCGFFQVKRGRIVFRRGYWDKLSFLRQQGLPLPREEE
jgi:limonene-1,2-epoxide hydrolase